jgi:hypothetical protein
MQDSPTSDVATPAAALAVADAPLATYNAPNAVSDADEEAPNLSAVFTIRCIAGRNILSTALAPAPPAGTRIFFSCRQMRFALTCEILICSLHGIRLDPSRAICALSAALTFTGVAAMIAAVVITSPSAAAVTVVEMVVVIVAAAAAAAADLISIARSEANSRSRDTTCNTTHRVFQKWRKKHEVCYNKRSKFKLKDCNPFGAGLGCRCKQQQ